MNFIFNEDLDRISKNFVLCSLHFTVDWFMNKAQFDAGFSKRLKLEDDAVPAILDLTVMSQHKYEQLFSLHGHYCIISSYRSCDMYWDF